MLSNLKKEVPKGPDPLDDGHAGVVPYDLVVRTLTGHLGTPMALGPALRRMVAPRFGGIMNIFWISATPFS
jgi:hypothetical protein